MDETEGAATDPRALAVRILTSRGKDVDMVEVHEIVQSACGDELSYEDFYLIADETWDLIGDAEITVWWPDDNDRS